MMDAERGRCVPRIRKVGRLGVKFNWAQVVGRFVSVLFELGAVCFIALLYSYWRTEPTTRVDVLFPSFFPVGWIRCAVIPPEPLTDTIVQLIFGIAADTYEVVSLLFLNRRRAINAVAVCCDVAVIGTGIFCFLLLSVVDRGSGERRAYWVTDMTNAMIFMIVFWFVKSIPRPQASWKLALTRSDPSMIHAGFIVMAAAGVIHIYFSNKAKQDPQLVRSQAEMVHFSVRRGLALVTRPTAE